MRVEVGWIDGMKKNEDLKIYYFRDLNISRDAKNSQHQRR